MDDQDHQNLEMPERSPVEPDSAEVTHENNTFLRQKNHEEKGYIQHNKDRFKKKIQVYAADDSLDDNDPETCAENCFKRLNQSEESQKNFCNYRNLEFILDSNEGNADYNIGRDHFKVKFMFGAHTLTYHLTCVWITDRKEVGYGEKFFQRFLEFDEKGADFDQEYDEGEKEFQRLQQLLIQSEAQKTEKEETVDLDKKNSESLDEKSRSSSDLKKNNSCLFDQQ